MSEANPQIQTDDPPDTAGGKKKRKPRPPAHHVEIEVGNTGRMLLKQMSAVHEWRTTISTYVKAHAAEVERGRKFETPPPPPNLVRRVADYITYLAVARGGQDLGHAYFPFLYPMPKLCWRPFVNGITFSVKDDSNEATRMVALVSHWPAPPDTSYPATISAQGSKWLFTYRGGNK